MAGKLTLGVSCSDDGLLWWMETTKGAVEQWCRRKSEQLAAGQCSTRKSCGATTGRHDSAPKRGLGAGERREFGSSDQSSMRTGGGLELPRLDPRLQSRLWMARGQGN
jgi:hypothetical protein